MSLLLSNVSQNLLFLLDSIPKRKATRNNSSRETMQKMSSMSVICTKFYANSFIFVGLFLERYAKYLVKFLLGNSFRLNVPTS